MNLQPLKDRVLIKPDDAPTMTASGLYLMEHWKPEQTGTVVAVGAPHCRKCQERVSEVAEGDHVIFSWQAGHEVWFNDGESRLLVLKESDILAVVEE